MKRTFGHLQYNKRSKKWILETNETHVVIRLKQMFPRLSKEAISPFTFSHNDMTCMDLDWFISRYPMMIDKNDYIRLSNSRRSYEKLQIDLETILSPDWKPPEIMGLKDGQRLRLHQTQNIELIKKNNNLLIGDAVGLGKTYSAMGLATIEECLPIAIVVEPHLQIQWQEKIEEFIYAGSNLITTKTQCKIPEREFTLFRYSNIAGWTNLFAKKFFKTVIYDEIQNLRTGLESEKGRSANILSNYTEYHVGLSATPIYNMGSEIYEIFRFLKGGESAHVLGTETEFFREWVSDGKKVKNPEALGTFLRESRVYVRRSKGDVGQKEDNVGKVVFEIPYDDSEIKKVEDLAKVLAIKSFTGTFVEKGRAVRDLDIMLRHATGVAKARSIANYAKMILETGEKVLIGAWHRDVYEILLKELKEYNPCMYTGSESPAKKQKSKEAFVSGESQVMLISLRSGSGLDGIQKVCSHVIIGELDWSPKVHEQLIGRLDREGQPYEVTAHFLHTEAGSDPAIIELLGIKNSQIKGIVNPYDDEDFEFVQVDESKLKSLAINWLTKHNIPVPTDKT